MGCSFEFLKMLFLSGKLRQKFWRTEVEPSAISTLQFFEIVLWKSQNQSLINAFFLKLQTSCNSKPEKGDTPIITMDNTELSLWGTSESWYVVLVLCPLVKMMFCESSLFLFMLCYFICYAKENYIFIEKKNSNIFLWLGIRSKLVTIWVKDTF